MSFWNRLRTPAQPTVPALARPLDTALACALAALGFFLPFSPAGVSVSMLALLLLALAAAPSVWRSAPWREPAMAAGLLLLAWIAIHTLWSSGFSREAANTINRYHELAVAPLLLALFLLVSRKRAFLLGLALGAGLYAIVQWAALLSPPLALSLQPRRISAGFGLAVCAFVLLEQARHEARPWIMRGLALFLAATVLFAIDGRTGHVVLLVLLACAAWQHSPRRWRWGAMVAMPVLAVVLVLVVGSNGMRSRITETMSGTQAMADGALSSTGIRIELLRNGLDLAERNFIAGGGYANYEQLHLQAARERYAGDPVRRHYLGAAWTATRNPHNEYLMQLVGGGAVALVLLLAWLALPLVRATQPGRNCALAGVALAFAAGCLFNSLLMDFVEGHLYMALLAWLLAQAAQPAVDPGTGAV